VYFASGTPTERIGHHWIDLAGAISCMGIGNGRCWPSMGRAGSRPSRLVTIRRSTKPSPRWRTGTAA
jgi:hypothetical protein